MYKNRRHQELLVAKLLLSSLSDALLFGQGMTNRCNGAVIPAYFKRGPLLRLFVLLSSFLTLVAK